MYHMLAVFDKETARGPVGIESWVAASLPNHHFKTEEEARIQEDLCRNALERAFSASKPTTRKLELLGRGNGVTFEASPFCSYATKSGLHVLFAGEVSYWPGIDAVSAAHNAFVRGDNPPEENDAHWLLDFYESFMNYNGSDVIDKALKCLSEIQGEFAFVIYDEVQKRVLAGRDASATQPLYWGANDNGQLLFGSRLEDLEGCNPSAISFPAGTLFASEQHTLAYNPGEKGWVISDDQLPGQLLSFVKVDDEHWRGVKAIPRITSKGVLCGAVFKVASMPDVTHNNAAH